MPASHNTGVTGKTMMGTGAYYAPYVPNISLLGDFYGRAEWKLTFLLWPRRCVLSNKLLWLKYAYEGTATWHGPGEPVHETLWHDKIEHIIFQLKR
jgi:hypothetical protein